MSEQRAVRTFATPEMGLAAYLRLRGFTVAGTKVAGGGRVWVVFEKTEDLDAARADFVNSDFARYLGHYRDLTTLVKGEAQSAREGDREGNG